MSLLCVTCDTDWILTDERNQWLGFRGDSLILFVSLFPFLQMKIIWGCFCDFHKSTWRSFPPGCCFLHFLCVFFVLSGRAVIWRTMIDFHSLITKQRTITWASESFICDCDECVFFSVCLVYWHRNANHENRWFVRHGRYCDPTVPQCEANSFIFDFSPSHWNLNNADGFKVTFSYVTSCT